MAVHRCVGARRRRGGRSRARILCLVSSLLVLDGVSAAQHASGSEPPRQSAPTELRTLDVSPRALSFGSVAVGTARTLDLTLSNRGFETLALHCIAFLPAGSGDSAAFRVTLQEQDYAGGAATVVHALLPPVVLAPGGTLTAAVRFAPEHDQRDEFVLRLASSHATVDVPVSGDGSQHADPYLHVVIDGPSWLVDYDRDASEALVLDGSASHTHEPGRSIAAYLWRAGTEVLGSTATLSTVLAAPTTPITLTISDDNAPPRTLDGDVEVRVVPPEQVPGVLARYHAAGEGGAAALLDAVLLVPDFVEQRPLMGVSGALQVGGSPFTGDVLVQLVGRIALDEAGTYDFTATGGAGHRLLVDGVEAPASLLLQPGTHEIEVRFAVDTLADLPLDVALVVDGVSQPLPGDLYHDETGVIPVVHALTSTGAPAGGDAITIDGFGFFAAADVVVHWGEVALVAAYFDALAPTRIEFPSPAGSGTIDVTVENANGVSAARSFTYSTGAPPPIQFRRDSSVAVPAPTAATWASDGKLYVASLDGRITALELDEEYALVAQTLHAGVSALPNRETLAVAVDPHDPPGPVRLYVAHGDLFLHGGAPPAGPSPYTGQVSVLTGPDFSAPTPLITGLPVSNDSHAINALAFDDNGDLLISVGSMTNAGVLDPGLGGLPESPLSAAVLKARLSKPDFDGAVRYVETLTGVPNDDQRFGESVDVAPGCDVHVHAAGLRNAYGMVYTTAGKLYVTDNGPNVGYGPASTGPDTQAPDPSDGDELNLIEWGNYYGLPNRSRGRTDPRQNVYHGSLLGPPSLPNTFSQMIAGLPSSSDGIDEYRASTFEGRMRGELIVQKFLGKARRVRLRADGRALVAQAVIEPVTYGLGCLTGPGGAILVLDYQHSEVEVLAPEEPEPLAPVVHDIFPWRAPHAGGAPFVVAGRGFGTLASTAVALGGRPATLTEVTERRIRGIVPAAPDATPALLDVVVSVAGSDITLPAAFRYLLGKGNEPGRWEALADASAELGAVAAGVLDGTLVVVGTGTSATLAYDLDARAWRAALAPRPFPGGHHAAAVVDGRLHLVGGLGGGAEGRVQVYDPLTGAWTAGADLPWSGGALATAVLDGKIYAAGGSVDGDTVAHCASYDPLTETWTMHASMPAARSHAAGGTDGTRLFVFGGRCAEPALEGADSVMAYDPGTDAWIWSGGGEPRVAPLPEGRSGMGSALSFRGELYLFGGAAGADPAAAHARVDVYDPLADSWRSEAPLSEARHGIWPVLYQGHVFVAGGATATASSGSRLLATFTRQ